MVLPSHATETKNFRVSNRRMQADNFSSFFSRGVKYAWYDNSSRSSNLFSILAPSVYREPLAIWGIILTHSKYPSLMRFKMDAPSDWRERERVEGPRFIS